MEESIANRLHPESGTSSASASASDTASASASAIGDDVHRESVIQEEMSVRDWLLKMISDIDAPTLYALSEVFRNDGLNTYGDVLECIELGTLDLNDIKRYLNIVKLSKKKADMIVKAVQNMIW